MTNLLSPFLGELLGTFVLITLGCGISMNLSLKKCFGVGNTSAMSGPLAWGFAVAMAVIVAMPFDSGAHFNPAVTFGLAVVGKFAWAKVIPYIIAQLIGAFFGAVTSWFVYKSHFDASSDEPDKMLSSFATCSSIKNDPRSFCNEILATFVLVFVILMMLPAHVEVKGHIVPYGLGSIGALPVGFLIFTIGMAYGGVTTWSINPARDLMPRLAHQLLPIKGKGGSNWEYGFRVGGLAPMIGALVAGLIFLLVKNYAELLDFSSVLLGK